MLFNPDPKRTFMIADIQDINVERNLEFDRDIIIDQIFVGATTITDLTLAVIVGGFTIWSAQDAALPIDDYYGNAVGFIDNTASLVANDAPELKAFVPIHCKRGDSINYIIAMVAPSDFNLTIVYHSFYELENGFVTVP